MVVPIGLSVSTIAVAFLSLRLSSFLGDGAKHQSCVPFLLGLLLALVAGVRPVNRIHSVAGRLIVRCVVFTLCLAPVPFGWEGRLVPTLLVPVLWALRTPFPVVFPFGPVWTFFAVVGVVASAESVASEARRKAERAAPNRGPATKVDHSQAPDNQPSVS